MKAEFLLLFHVLYLHYRKKWGTRSLVWLYTCIFRVTNRVKSLLNLIPTDPAVSDALDHVGQRVSEIFLVAASFIDRCTITTSESVSFSNHNWSSFTLSRSERIGDVNFRWVLWIQCTIYDLWRHRVCFHSVNVFFYRMARFIWSQNLSKQQVLLVIFSVDLFLQLLRQPSPEEPNLSPRGSPRKFTPSPTPQNSNNKPTSTKEVLKSLFDSAAPDMSTFRVLYNLEVKMMIY